MKTKRILTLVLSAALATSMLAGCNNSTSGSAAASNSNAAAASTGAAKSAAWPKGSVQLLVPSKAGGITDIYTRNVQEALQSATGGSFATVNYDTEAVGYENLRSAKKDGSTLLFQHSTILCKYLTGNLNYDPTKEFTVVGEVAYMGSQAIIASPKAPYNTWEEFVEYCKKNPGKVNTAISTNGTTHFIFGQVEKTCNIKLNLVECSSEADKLTNVAGGIIDVANCSMSNAKEYEKAGKLKVLGILGSGKAEPDFPDWKPITDVKWESHLFCFAPAGIDEATAKAINESLKGLTEDKKFAEACKKVGGSPEWFSLEDCQKNFKDTENELSEVATALGINAHK